MRGDGRRGHSFKLFKRRYRLDVGRFKFANLDDLMAQRLVRRAENREVPGSSPTQGLTFQSCSRYQLNQLGSKAASESTFKKSNTCGVSNNRLYFYRVCEEWNRLDDIMMMWLLWVSECI